MMTPFLLRKDSVVMINSKDALRPCSKSLARRTHDDEEKESDNPIPSRPPNLNISSLFCMFVFLLSVTTSQLREASADWSGTMEFSRPRSVWWGWYGRWKW